MCARERNFRAHGRVQSAIFCCYAQENVEGVMRGVLLSTRLLISSSYSFRFYCFEFYGEHCIPLQSKWQPRRVNIVCDTQSIEERGVLDMYSLRSAENVTYLCQSRFCCCCIFFLAGFYFFSQLWFCCFATVYSIIRMNAADTHSLSLCPSSSSHFHTNTWTACAVGRWGIALLRETATFSLCSVLRSFWFRNLVCSSYGIRRRAQNEQMANNCITLIAFCRMMMIQRGGLNPVSIVLWCVRNRWTSYILFLANEYAIRLNASAGGY